MKYSFRLNENGDKKFSEIKNYLFSRGLIKSDNYTDVIKMALISLENDILAEEKNIKEKQLKEQLIQKRL